MVFTKNKVQCIKHFKIYKICSINLLLDQNYLQKKNFG